jgi:hypothetical protein
MCSRRSGAILRQAFQGNPGKADGQRLKKAFQDQRHDPGWALRGLGSPAQRRQHAAERHGANPLGNPHRSSVGEHDLNAVFRRLAWAAWNGWRLRRPTIAISLLPNRSDPEESHHSIAV